MFVGKKWWTSHWQDPPREKKRVNGEKPGVPICPLDKKFAGIGDQSENRGERGEVSAGEPATENSSDEGDSPTENSL